MLQQTQAARVVGPYRAFLRRFPTPAVCARAPLGEVLRSWSGLGYNRRAARLHEAAATIVSRHDGRVPDRLEELMALPGVGPYTARAVLAFAFERPVGVVDVNVRRVLCRLSGMPLDRGRAQALADRLVPADRPWAWNQAIVEHGATCCTARHPRCGDCPLARSCGWARSGCRAPDPARPARPPQPRFEGSYRQGRGRLLAALCRGPIGASTLAAACGWPDDPDRARRAAAGLVGDGLARWTAGGGLALA